MTHIDKLTNEEVFADVNSPDFPTRLFRWLDSRWSGSNLSTLSIGEHAVLAIRFAQMDINGNSFPGFFESPPDDRPKTVVEALRLVGANKSAMAIEEIGKILFEGPVPSTTEERSEALMNLEDDEEESEKRIEECRKKWEQVGEDLLQLSIQFAKSNPHLF